LKLYSFILKGEFASFRKPDTNAPYLTYSMIPYPGLLGIFGAMAGKSGYVDQTGTYPTYYEEYHTDIFVGIKPVFQKGTNGFQKKFVKFSNLHGYGSNEAGGNLIITEQILISPAWQIFLFDKNDQFRGFIKKISEYETVFTPYLGKNEFRAEISNFEELENAVEITEEVKDKKSMKFDSVTLLKKPDKHPIIKNLSKGISFEKYFEAPKSQISDDGYSIFENYPYALGKDLHYKLTLSVFTNWEINPSTLMEGTRVFRIRDLEGKERTIQMFNGGLE
jgi:CRISPR-associated protein Cas5h